MRHLLFGILFSILTVSSFSQKMLLSDTFFASSFSNDTFHFSNLTTSKNPHWQMLVAECISQTKKLSKKTIDSFYSKRDSIQNYEASIIKYNKEICLLQCEIKFNECMKSNYHLSDKYHLCDSIKTLYRNTCDSIITSEEKKLEQKWSDLNFDFFHTKTFRIYKNYTYSSSEIIEKVSKDSISCNFKTFSGSPGWFILSLNNNKFNYINSKQKLLSFLGKIDNQYKAFFVLQATKLGQVNTIPITNQKILYKKIGKSYYFIKEYYLSSCPIKLYNCLISVDENGEVTIIDKIKVKESSDCL